MAVAEVEALIVGGGLGYERAPKQTRGVSPYPRAASDRGALALATLGFPGRQRPSLAQPVSGHDLPRDRLVVIPLTFVSSRRAELPCWGR
jgi:hypothetical protein